MRICPACKNKFSKGRWALGMFHTYCPYCNAHLRLAIDWRCIPLIIMLYVFGALCSSHFIFIILTIIVGILLWLYLCNLSYRQI